MTLPKIPNHTEMPLEIISPSCCVISVTVSEIYFTVNCVLTPDLGLCFGVEKDALIVSGRLLP